MGKGMVRRISKTISKKESMGISIIIITNRLSNV
jgi:hypothetical protein